MGGNIPPGSAAVRATPSSAGRSLAVILHLDDRTAGVGEVGRPRVVGFGTHLTPKKTYSGVIFRAIDYRRLKVGAAQFRDGETLFLCRVGGVAVHLGRVLLHRSEHEDFWAVPGGRIEVGETSEQALKREMLEELGAEVSVGRLLWVIENFFRNTPLDKPPNSPAKLGHHELGLYLKMQVPPDLAETDSFVGAELVGTQHEFALEYRWFQQSEIAGLDVRPAPFRELLTRPLPTGASRVVNNG